VNLSRPGVLSRVFKSFLMIFLNFIILAVTDGFPIWWTRSTLKIKPGNPTRTHWVIPYLLYSNLSLFILVENCFKFLLGSLRVQWYIILYTSKVFTSTKTLCLSDHTYTSIFEYLVKFGKFTDIFPFG